MTKDELGSLAASLMEARGLNRLRMEDALSPALAGIPLYDAPLIGVGAADDPLFADLKRPGAVGPHFLAPEEWLPGARSVVCLFFPMSAAVREENRRRMDWPGFGWMHARAEGMDMIDRLVADLAARLADLGHQVIVPAKAPRFFSVEDAARNEFSSNWSERHAAYVCGLGTFGLSKGLITKKGVAGRFASLMTDLALPADAREYSGLYEYCSSCGACSKNCPARAISLKEGKNHLLCSAFVERTIKETPQRPGAGNRRYGCGKCQVKVPCETRAMARRRE